MKSILGLAAAACLLVGLSAERASADVLDYEAVVSGDFRKGQDQNYGSFSGSFEFTRNGDVLTLTSAAIATSPGTSGGWAKDYVYGNPDASLNTATLGAFNKDVLNLVIDKFSLQLQFNPDLLTYSVTAIQADSSFEHPDKGGNRDVIEGSGSIKVTLLTPPNPPAVPEPSTIAVVGICAPALLVYAQRRRRKGAAAA